MATTRISALTELTNPASTDVLVINDDSAGSTKKIQLSNLIPDDAIDSEHYVAGSIDNEHLANDAVGIDELSATGTASSSTFLRGDNSWVTPTDTNTTYSVQDGELSEINFTSADHTKLNAIEASADVTDATNVTAAGALMDSELAGIAAVKATTGTFLTADQTKLDGIETSATADQTGAEIKTAYEAEANAYTDTKNTKLAGIETSATADQTAGEILTLIEDGIDSVHYVDASIDNVHLADDAVGIEELSATGTASGSTFLRGDNTWAAPSGASTATSSATGVIKIEDDTDQSVAAESVSTTANRTYGLQLNSSDQGVVNVPWTDTNTTYSAGDFKLDDLGAPDDNTDLNFTTSAHGLVPKGTNTGNFLKDDGTWASAGGGIASLVADTSPQLGGNLDLNTNDITGTGGINITGTVETATLNLDGTTESSPAEGDIWYDSGKFYLGTSLSFTGVWSSGGNLATARRYLAGAGTQSAGFCMGGKISSASNVTEEYDGTSWSAGGNLATARDALAGAGTQTAGLCMGGDEAGSVSNVTEEYDGTSWSAGGNLGTAREQLAGAGTLTAGICMGGYDGSVSNVTEEYDGTSWSAGGNLGTARSRLAGAGTQTAGLCMGGDDGSATNVTEEYNGTSWSAVGNLGTARHRLAGAGTQSAGLCMGGTTGSVSNVTEEYNGTSWAAGGNLATAREQLAGAGTLTAGICMGGTTGSVSNVTEEYNKTVNFNELFTASEGL